MTRAEKRRDVARPKTRPVKATPLAVMLNGHGAVEEFDFETEPCRPAAPVDEVGTFDLLVAGKPFVDVRLRDRGYNSP